MRQAVILLAFAGYIPAAITDVRVQGTTQTQAAISYTAPDVNACTIEVYNLDEDAMVLEIASVSDTTPIQVTLKSYVYWETGDKVYIYGNASAEGYWTITRDVNDPSSFTLNGSTAHGTVSGGRVGALVHDVNPRLFAGADQDYRPGNLSRGRSRTALAGRRVAEQALTGWYVSRALELNTKHQFRILCGPDQVTGTFQTANAPMGNLNPEPLPVDPDHPGRYLYPSIDWSHPEYPQDTTITVTNDAPCYDYGKVTFSAPVSLAAGSIMVLKSGAQRGRARSVFKTITSTSVCVERGFSAAQPAGTQWASRPPNIGAGVQRIIDPQTGYLIRRMSSPGENFTVVNNTVAGAASQTGEGWRTEGGSASLLEGIGAAGDGKTVAYTGGASREWLWVRWPMTWHYGDANRSLDAIMAHIRGSVDAPDPDRDNNSIEICLKDPASPTLSCKSAVLSVDLTACTSGDCYAGSAEPMLAAWRNATDPAGSYVGLVNFHGAAGGILIRKKTTFPNTVILDRVLLDVDRSSAPSNITGTCEPAKYPQTYGGISRDGYICGLAQSTTLWHWIDPVSGDATSIGAAVSATGSGLVGPSFGLIYDPVTPNTAYSAQTVSNGHKLQKTNYVAAGTEYLVNTIWLQQDPSMAIRSSYLSNETLEAKMEAATAGTTHPYHFWTYPGGVGSTASGCLLSGVQDDVYLQIVCTWGQESEGWKGIYSPSSDQIIATSFSNGGYPERGCAYHASGGLISGGYTPGIGLNPLGGGSTCGAGPYQTELAASLEGTGTASCPNLPYEYQTSGRGSGAGGSPQCSVVQVNGDYRDPNPCSYYTIDNGRLTDITISGGTATAHAAETVNNSLSAGMTVRVTGSGVVNLDGEFPIATVSSTSFTFAVNGAAEGAYTTPGMLVGRLCGTQFCETDSRGATTVDPLRTLMVGDILKIDNEIVQVLGKGAECSDPNAACNLTVLRGISLTAVAPHAENAVATQRCGSATSAFFQQGYPVIHEVYWNYVADPAATDPSSRIYTVAGHGTMPYRGRAVRVSTYCTRTPWGYCFKSFTGDVASQSRQFLSDSALQMADVVKFAGVKNSVWGDSHISSPPLSGEWVTDVKAFSGGDPSAWTEVEPGTKLFKTAWAAKPKHTPVEFACGNRAVVDVSPGPIGSAASDAYKACIPQVAGECYPGAQAGEVYLNCPDATLAGCDQSADSDVLDKCVRQLDFKTHSYRQIGITAEDLRAERQRAITNGFQKNRLSTLNGYVRFGSLPGGEWGIFVGAWLDDVRSDFMLVKMPPFGETDSVSRGTFQQIQVHLGSAPKGTDNVVAEFGYDPDFRCTSRRESCIANGTGTLNEATPFYWYSEPYTGLACTSGCMITIPALPQRALYYRILYRAADGTLIRRGPTQVGLTN